jgi:hypothetical protein
VIADPAHWDFIPEEIGTIKPREWLSSSLIDHVLLCDWLQAMDVTPVYWFPIKHSHGTMLLQTLSKEDITLIRSSLNLPGDGSLEMKPVVVGVYHSNHYFVAVFDYRTDCLYTLGKSIRKVGYIITHNWDSWDGRPLWRIVAKIFGWGVADWEPEQQELNWKQVCLYPNIMRKLILMSETEWS